MGRKIAVVFLSAILLFSALAVTVNAESSGLDFDLDRFLTTPSGKSTGWKYENGYYFGSPSSLRTYYGYNVSTSEGSFINNFEQGSRYIFSFFGRGVSSDNETLKLLFKYDDGTTDLLTIFSSQEDEYYSYTSAAGKNLTGLYFTYNSGTYVYIRDFEVVRRFDDMTSYDNVIPNDIVDVFRDIIADQSILSDYVACCTKEGEYSLFIGNIGYKNSKFSSDEKIKLISLKSDENNKLVYSSQIVSGLSLFTEGKVIYSNLGDFPNLIRRGEVYEILQTILIVIIGCCILISRIFGASKR